jgi:hypothetical protein
MTNPDLKQASTYLKTTKIKEFISPKHWQQFLSPLKNSHLSALVKRYQADKSVKKLFTGNILTLSLFIGLVAGKTISLRLIVIMAQSNMARLFTGLTSGISRSGLSDRNEALPCNLFRDLVLMLAQRVNRKGRRLVRHARDQIKIFDSTFLSLAHKLIPWACQSLTKGLVSVTIRIDQGSWVPERVIIRNKPDDQTVFKNLIDWDKQGITYLFDRGFSDFETIGKISQSGNFFITRMPAGYVYQVVKALKIASKSGTGIKIIQDEVIKVGGKTRPRKWTARLITAINDQQEILYFLTNRFDLTALEVCEIYRCRWEIEILFRWLKTQLKIERVISYTENGFYVQIYLALILHLLIMLYRAKQRDQTLSALTVYRYLRAWIYDWWGVYMFTMGWLSANSSLQKEYQYE